MKWVALNEDGQRIGESHPRAKLTDHDIDLMFELHDDGMSPIEIAVKFEITPQYARRVLKCAQRNQVAARWKRTEP